MSEPRLNTAAVYGARPGSPLLFHIAAVGERPMTFGADGLPPGLALDAASGVISGTTGAVGTYHVVLHAENAHGRAEKPLRIVIGIDFALTPPMGFNTWGGWGPAVTEANVREGAQALFDTGLAEHGYCYVNIDDGWQGHRDGALQPNDKFGDPARLCADLHRLGLKVGTYSTPWVSSYAGFCGGSSDEPSGAWQPSTPVHAGWRCGRHLFDQTDAQQVAAWGFDYFKYDWLIDSVDLARSMGNALRDSGRDIVLELSNSAPLAEATAYTEIASMCRTTGDIVDVWDRSQLDDDKRRWALGVRDIWLGHRAWQAYNRPGHWNMPCPLRVGLLGGWDLQPLRPTRLTADEQYSHVSLWCLWSAPLIIGCPPERLDAFTLGLLTNDEVLALDQDELGHQAYDLEPRGSGEVLVKELADGTRAVGLFNVGDSTVRVGVAWSELGLTGPQQVRDLWRQADLGERHDDFAADVPPHGVVLVKLTPA
ncbi:MAG: putative Ig domain-containing protein [Armatimonadetes bacterium]|nr:putative Ig domain-containing protein [Armatimonadota bacterium]